MANPGDMVPYGADYLVRRIDDLERKIKELGPSVASSFATTVAGIVLPTSNVNYVNNIAVTTTPTVVVSLTFTVPIGFTRVHVTAFSSAQALNSQASGDYLYCQTLVNGATGGELYDYAAAGISTGVTSPNFSTITGLTAGQVITVSTKIRTNTGTWAASTANQFNAYASALFLY